jgi:hypothetical protein
VAEGIRPRDAGGNSSRGCAGQVIEVDLGQGWADASPPPSAGGLPHPWIWGVFRTCGFWAHMGGARRVRPSDFLFAHLTFVCTRAAHGTPMWAHGKHGRTKELDVRTGCRPCARTKLCARTKFVCIATFGVRGVPRSARGPSVCGSRERVRDFSGYRVVPNPLLNTYVHMPPASAHR